VKHQLNAVLQSFRDFVSNHDYEDTPILTAYVDVDPSNPENQRHNPAWRIELKDEARRLEGELDPEKLKRRDIQRQVASTEEVLLKHLEDGDRSGRGTVFFSDLDDHVVFDLPIPVPTRLYYGIPQVKQLLFALDHYRKYIVVLFANDDIRAVEVFLTRTTDEIRIKTGLKQLQEFGRKAKTLAKERRDADYERRYVSEAAGDIDRYFMADPDVDRIIFGGNAKVAHAVLKKLHPAVQKLVVAIEPLEFTTPDQEIGPAIRPVAERHEAEYDLSVVDSLVSTSSRGGPAVVDRAGVEAALAIGKVRTLVLPYPIDSDEFDVLILQATEIGADVEFVYGKGADRLNALGGVGAQLYYA
jgi:hypothetical protein